MSLAGLRVPCRPSAPQPRRGQRARRWAVLWVFATSPPGAPGRQAGHV